MHRNFAFVLALVIAMGTSLSDAGAQLRPPPKKLPPVVAAPSWTTYTASAQKGLANAVLNWTTTVAIGNVKILGPIANGGQFQGPPLSGPILQQMTKDNVPTDIALAFDSSLSNAWTSWTASATLPGLQLYPIFASYPGGYAPPTPNVPTPLNAFASSIGSMTAPALSSSLTRALGAHMKDLGAQQAVTDFANLVASHFTAFMTSCLVTTLMGSGPVPAFDPPYVNASMVVGGQGTMTPGGLASCHWLP